MKKFKSKKIDFKDYLKNKRYFKMYEQISEFLPNSAYSYLVNICISSEEKIINVHATESIILPKINFIVEKKDLLYELSLEDNPDYIRLIYCYFYNDEPKELLWKQDKYFLALMQTLQEQKQLRNNIDTEPKKNDEK